MATVTSQPLQLSYFVADITTALLTYNRLRWWRSETGVNGLYTERTQAAATAAILDSVLTEPHQLNGKEIKFRVNGVTEVAFNVAAADPVTTADLISEITGATALVTPTDPGDGTLRMTTVSTGSGASIEILDGDANVFLGWAEGDGAIGQSTDTVLVSGTHEYYFTDQNSDRDWWYKVEFYHSSTLVTTGQGVPFPANASDKVPVSQSIVGYVRLADLSGNGLEGRNITFFNVGMPNNIAVVQGQVTTNWGVSRQYAQINTDRNGYAEIRLLRGITIDINIEGGFTRRIAVPTTGDAFELLDPTLQVQDEFGIQEPDIPFAIRTS